MKRRNVILRYRKEIRRPEHVLPIYHNNGRNYGRQILKIELLLVTQLFICLIFQSLLAVDRGKHRTSNYRGHILARLLTPLIT